MAGSGTEPKYGLWGLGTTAAAVTDSGLQTAAAETSRVTGSTSRTTTTATNDTYQIVVTVTNTSGTNQAITEFGLWDASTSGNFFLHAVFSADNVSSASDSIQFTVNVAFVSG